MAYDFKNLSPLDFEDLVRDLIGCELDIRFEAFCAGPDGGMDGRHSKGDKSIILQAKHREGSQFASLLSAIRNERPKIETLQASRYLLATSKGLTPPNKTALARAIGPSLQNEADIFSADDLESLLRKHSRGSHAAHAHTQAGCSWPVRVRVGLFASAQTPTLTLAVSAVVNAHLERDWAQIRAAAWRAACRGECAGSRRTVGEAELTQEVRLPVPELASHRGTAALVAGNE